MKKYKLFFKILLILCLASNLFADTQSYDNKEYFITGSENKFKLSNKDLKNTFDIDGTENRPSSKKLTFTKYQKMQLEYLEMEKKYKLLALDKEIDSRKKLLEEELSNEFSDTFLINKISDEIKSLTIDKETVSLNVDKKIRYVLSSEQYLKYKQEQKEKSKKK